MHDKTIRRRRAVLGLLVASCLILLTAYFGEPAGGGLHSVQRGVNQILNPIQEGSSRALKPARDLFGWFGDTFHAKGELKELRAERDRYLNESTAAQGALKENQDLRRLLALGKALSLDQYEPRGARVFAQSPNIWWSRVSIDRGSAGGVRVGMPVISSAGLVGHVDEVTRGSAIVTLITDNTSAVTGRGNTSRSVGIVYAAGAGDPNDLVMKYTDSEADKITPEERIVTAGTAPDATKFDSLYPPGLPIGRVTRIEDAGSQSPEVHLRPFANLRKLDYVQVLTAAPSDNKATAGSTG